jgi:hypothetical protein
MFYKIGNVVNKLFVNRPRTKTFLIKIISILSSNFKIIIYHWVYVIKNKSYQDENQLIGYDSAIYNNIIDDLIDYTGFSKEQLIPYLNRYPGKNFHDEFNWYQPF